MRLTTAVLLGYQHRAWREGRVSGEPVSAELLRGPIIGKFRFRLRSEDDRPTSLESALELSDWMPEIP